MPAQEQNTYYSPLASQDILDLEAASQLLRITVDDLNKLLEAEDLPGRIIAGEWRFSRSALIKWLGEGKWDVVHFNWGLHDLCYRSTDPKTPIRKDKANGRLDLTFEEYQQNLRKLVKILKATGAELIWASTTPVPDGESGRIKGDEIKYNKAARRIMRKNGVMINDLHAHAMKKLSEIQRPNGNVHFTPEGSGYLAERVTARIRFALRKSRKK